MKLAPAAPAQPHLRTGRPPAPSGGQSFTSMLGDGEPGVAFAEQRAMGFSETGLLGSRRDLPRQTDPAVPAVQPTQTPADQRAAARPASASAQPTIKLEAAQTPARAQPFERQRANQPPVATGGVTSSPGSADAPPASPPRRDVGGDEPLRLYQQRLHTALAQRASATVRLEPGKDGLVAIITADDPTLDRRSLVDKALRLAAEQGLTLAGLVLNGASLTQLELRYPEAPWPSRP